MQGENPVSLAIGTQVSAKYKGAFCEAKVRSVIKEVKCRVTFKGGLGSCTLSDDAIRSIDEQPLIQGANVKARHPDKQEYLDAVINQIKDQSKYTVTFNDGDIAQLRRNALRLKSGKHFNPSESLDNLPLTHPEHFSTPVGGSKHTGSGSGRRRNRSGSERSGQGGSRERSKDGGDNTDAERDDFDSDGESENDFSDGHRRDGNGPISSAYMPNIGRVVWAENTDKKSKGKETNWFPALVVAPTACDIPTDTKEDFLIRSFKDGRYYTVAKKDTNKFDKDNTSKYTKDSNIRDALQKAISYIEKDELPPHWDKEIIFAMDEPTTSTESSESASERSEDGEDEDSEEDEQTTEEKDHLIAELFKHMEDKGSPINHTPAINGQDVDLYKLYRVVDRLGGHTRVTNKNLWKQVGKKLGFENTWSINQVRVHYNRYLKSFEELNRTLGCTMVMAPLSRGRHQSGNVNRVQVRGHRGHRHHLVQQKSPMHKEALPPSPLASTNSCINSSTTQSSTLQQGTSTHISTSPRTESQSSSLGNKEGVDVETKATSSITSQIKNIDSHATQVKKLESTESSQIQARESQSNKDKSQRDKGIKGENSNKNDTDSEKESASKIKVGHKISKAFHNVMKNIKKSPRSATMEEKEISIPIKNDTEDEGIKEKISSNSKIRKDNSGSGSITSIKLTQTEQKNDIKMSRRQRKNSSTSSLAAAMQAKAQKDDIGNYTTRQDHSISTSIPNKKIASRLASEYGGNKLDKNDKESEADKKGSKMSNKFSATSTGTSSAIDSTDSNDNKTDKIRNSEKDGSNKVNNRKINSKYGSYSSSPGPGGKKKLVEGNIMSKKEKDSEDKKATHNDNEKQHLAPDDIVEVGDRIKVFYIRETIYPAKVIQVQEPKNGEQWPRYRVHYDGWNKRYDEWIKRSRIAEFNSEKEKTIAGGPPESTTEDSEPTSPPSTRKEASRKDSGMSTASSSSSSSRLDNATLLSKKKLRKAEKDAEVIKPFSRNIKASKLSGSNEKESVSRAGTPSSLRGSRTNSPVSALKRQNSRGSIKKDTDDSEAEADRETEEILSSDSAGGRKSSRLQKGNQSQTTVPSGDDRTKRSDRRSDRKRAARDESETDDTDNAKDDISKDNNKELGSLSKSKRGRKGQIKIVQDDSESEDNKSTSDIRKPRNTEKNNTRSSSAKSNQGSIRSTRTPLKGLNSDQEDDPYDFKEPEPFDVDAKFETPRKQSSPSPAISSAGQKIRDDDFKKEMIEGSQMECVYSSAAESSSSSSKQVTASNLSSVASSASSASDEGNFSDDEKPNIEKLSKEEDPLQLREEDLLEESVGRNKRNKVEKHEPGRNADHNGEESIIGVHEDIDEDELCASLNKPLPGGSEVGKPLLPLPKKLQEVFPHLAAIRTTALPGNSPRGHVTSTVGNCSTSPSNPSTNVSNIPKSNSSQVPSQSLQINSSHKSGTVQPNQSQGLVGRTICTPPIAKQKPTEISESMSNKSGPAINKQDLNIKDRDKISSRRSRSRSPLPLSIVAEDIIASQTSNSDTLPPKKQRRKPTKPTSSELVGSESESENDEEDVEADGDVDSNGEDTIIQKGRFRQQQQHRKRSTARVDSKKDNRSSIASVTSSASSNDNSPSKLINKHSPNSKGKNRSVTTSLTVKPLTNVGVPTASTVKRKRDLDATSETTESDEESLTRSKMSSQNSTKRGSMPNDKIKRLKKEANSSSYNTPDQDDLDLACGETIPGSPVHPGQSDVQNSSPEQFARETQNQKLSTSVGSNSSRINLPQNQTGSISDKTLLEDVSNSNTRSQPLSLQKSHSKPNTNRLEMPFASVPESIHSSTSNDAEEKVVLDKLSGTQACGKINVKDTSNGHMKIAPSGSSSKGKHFQRDGDIESLQGYSSTSQSPTHGEDSAGNSTSKSPQDQNDLQGDSSEVDMDSLSGRGAGSGADSSTWPGEVRNKASVKRKTAERHNVTGNILNMRERGSRSPATGSRSPLTHSSQVGKRKKRTRKTSMSTQGGLRGRKRHGSGRNGILNRDDDSDDEDEGMIETRQHSDSRQSTRVSSLGSLDNDALAALSQRSPRTSKFNFYVKFDPLMDSSERISKLQSNLEELRKTYMTLRSKLTSIERRRKKIRKREREKSDNPSGPEVEAVA